LEVDEAPLSSDLGAVILVPFPFLWPAFLDMAAPTCTGWFLAIAGDDYLSNEIKEKLATLTSLRRDWTVRVIILTALNGGSAWNCWKIKI